MANTDLRTHEEMPQAGPGGVLSLPGGSGELLAVNVSDKETQLLDCYRHMGKHGRAVILDIALSMADLTASAFAAADGEEHSIWDELSPTWDVER